MQDDFQVGEWTVQLRLNRVSGPAGSVQLEPKVMEVLGCLAGRAGEVVRREELGEAVWPGTSVTDDVLSRCVSELRKAFGDDRSSPRYIQTIRKGGYRLVAPVSRPSEDEARAAPDVRASVRRRRLAWGALPLAVALAAGFAWNRWSVSPPGLRVVPATTYRGHEFAPSLSPDGHRLAFVWTGESDRNMDIYVKNVSDENALRLTRAPFYDLAPVWSPDNQRIAFSRSSPGGGYDIYAVPSLGGPELRLSAIRGAGPELDWSQDGAWIACSDRDDTDEPAGIFLLSLESLRKRRLTRPEGTGQSDRSPAFSPDSRRVAWVRGDGAADDIWVTPLEGSPLRRLTFDQRRIQGLDWTADGRSLVFASDRGGGHFILWEIALSSPAPRALAVSGRDIRQPSIAASGNRLAYTHFHNDYNIWKIVMEEGAESSAEALIASTQSDEEPSLSDDASRLAFISDRSGGPEVWIAGIDGSGQEQATSLGTSRIGGPRFSPDGAWIAFYAQTSSRADIHRIPAAGGAAERLTLEESDDVNPSWSRDGQSLYFASDRGGGWQIWRMPAAGGIARQVTRQGGYLAHESPDGQYLHYSKRSGGIFRMPVQGGSEESIVPELAGVHWGNWFLLPGKVCYSHSAEGSGTAVSCRDAGTGRTVRLTLNRHGPLWNFPGLAASADGRIVLFTRRDQSLGDIMLVENFR